MPSWTVDKSLRTPSSASERRKRVAGCARGTPNHRECVAHRVFLRGEEFARRFCEIDSIQQLQLVYHSANPTLYRKLRWKLRGRDENLLCPLCATSPQCATDSSSTRRLCRPWP